MKTENTVFTVEFSPSFEEKFNLLPATIQDGTVEAIRKLTKGLHSSIRLHRYTGVRPPYCFFDALPNHSYQIACERKGDRFLLLDIDTHKKIEKKSRK